MFRVFHQRRKCIGCNACVELLPSRWRISRRDGKATLIGAKENKGFYLYATHDESELAGNRKAAMSCPVKIIRLEQNR
jgi:ferredoxin